MVILGSWYKGPILKLEVTYKKMVLVVEGREGTLGFFLYFRGLNSYQYPRPMSTNRVMSTVINSS